MSTVLELQPGQTVTVIQQILNLDGYRQDGYVVSGVSGPNGEPVIARVITPTFTLLTGYPATMTQLDIGLYAYQFVLPTGGSSVGMYTVDIYWYHPTTYQLQQQLVLVNVTAPFGIYSVLPIG